MVSPQADTEKASGRSIAAKIFVFIVRTSEGALASSF
jgi:hypothetical protein